MKEARLYLSKNDPGSLCFKSFVSWGSSLSLPENRLQDRISWAFIRRDVKDKGKEGRQGEPPTTMQI